MKPHDKNRQALAEAIATHTAKLRDLRVAEEAAHLAATRHWEAAAAVEDLAKAPISAGSLAAELATHVSNGSACDVATLERHAINVGSQLAAAENDAKVWESTATECTLAVRASEVAVAEAKGAVARCARLVICGAETVPGLVDELAALQMAVIKARANLRFIWSHGLNGELDRPLADKIESLMHQDLSGMQPAPEYEKSYSDLMANPDAELPLVPERRL